MKKLLNWIINWTLAIGGCFSAKLETLYISRDKELMKRIHDIENGKTELVSFDELEW